MSTSLQYIVAKHRFRLHGHQHSKIAIRCTPAGGTHRRPCQKKTWRRTFQDDLRRVHLTVLASCSQIWGLGWLRFYRVRVSYLFITVSFSLGLWLWLHLGLGLGLVIGASGYSSPWLQWPWVQRPMAIMDQNLIWCGTCGDCGIWQIILATSCCHVCSAAREELSLSIEYSHIQFKLHTSDQKLTQIIPYCSWNGVVLPLMDISHAAALRLMHSYHQAMQLYDITEQQVAWWCSGWGIKLAITGLEFNSWPCTFGLALCVYKPIWYVTSHLGQLNLPFLRG